MHKCQTLMDSLFEIDHDTSKLNKNLLIDTLMFENP